MKIIVLPLELPHILMNNSQYIANSQYYPYYLWVIAKLLGHCFISTVAFFPPSN